MPLGLGALGFPETKMPKPFPVGDREIFPGYFPEMAFRVLREVFCSKSGLMEETNGKENLKNVNMN